jgi:DNA-binding CsgD family transcriptional regulator
MSAGTAVIPIVTVCDPRGAMIWTNHPNPEYKAGTPIWEYAAAENRELVKDRVSRATFLNEPQEFDVSTDQDEHYHVWVWPMLTENLGVCLVGMRQPNEISRLAARERACLERLAVGCSTAEIAAEFDVSVSTVHTYMKRAREKLGLTSMEHLIAYASRYMPHAVKQAPPQENHVREP